MEAASASHIASVRSMFFCRKCGDQKDKELCQASVGFQLVIVLMSRHGGPTPQQRTESVQVARPVASGGLRSLLSSHAGNLAGLEDTSTISQKKTRHST